MASDLIKKYIYINKIEKALKLYKCVLLFCVGLITGFYFTYATWALGILEYGQHKGNVNKNRSSMAVPNWNSVG